MEHTDYYGDRKYCHECGQYVHYLMSIEHSYCAHCGNRVRLFSDADWEQFHGQLAEQRPKGGRPRKNRESA
jgi:molybdenum cofactor biosynthesis enzyme MoaA